DDESEEEEDQRQDVAVDPESCDEPHEKDAAQEQLIGRGLEDDEGAEEDEKRNGPVADPGRRDRPADRHRRGGHDGQYAFSDVNSRIGVSAMILRSKSTDQFSM